jgi:hypothetical protein
MPATRVCNCASPSSPLVLDEGMTFGRSYQTRITDDMTACHGLADVVTGTLRPGHPPRRTRPTRSTGRAMYRSLFPPLMQGSCGISVAALRLDPSPGAAGDLSRFVGVHAWPDRRVDVMLARFLVSRGAARCTLARGSRGSSTATWPSAPNRPSEAALDGLDRAADAQTNG